MLGPSSNRIGTLTRISLPEIPTIGALPRCLLHNRAKTGVSCAGGRLCAPLPRLDSGYLGKKLVCFGLWERTRRAFITEMRVGRFVTVSNAHEESKVLLQGVSTRVRSLDDGDDPVLKSLLQSRFIDRYRFVTCIYLVLRPVTVNQLKLRSLKSELRGNRKGAQAGKGGGIDPVPKKQSTSMTECLYPTYVQHLARRWQGCQTSSRGY